HLFARLIICLVETDIEEVGGLRAGIARPAALEGKTCRQIAAVAACKVEPILAKSDDCGNFGWRIDTNIELAFGSAFRGFHPLEIPAAVGAIRLIIVAYSVKRPGDALARDAGAVRTERDDIEIRRRAIGQGGEIFLDPDETALRQNRHDKRALDGAAARLAGTQNNLGFKWPGCRDIGNASKDPGRALCIGRRKTLDLSADLVERLVLQPGHIAFEGRQ